MEGPTMDQNTPAEESTQDAPKEEAPKTQESNLKEVTEEQLQRLNNHTTTALNQIWARCLLIVKARLNPDSHLDIVVVERQDIEKKNKHIEHLKAKISSFETRLSKPTKHLPAELVILEKLNGHTVISFNELMEKVISHQTKYPDYEVFLNGAMSAIVAYPKEGFEKFKNDNRTNL